MSSEHLIELLPVHLLLLVPYHVKEVLQLGWLVVCHQPDFGVVLFDGVSQLFLHFRVPNHLFSEARHTCHKLEGCHSFAGRLVHRIRLLLSRIQHPGVLRV